MNWKSKGIRRKKKQIKNSVISKLNQFYQDNSWNIKDELQQKMNLLLYEEGKPYLNDSDIQNQI